jgi:organic radical activating enzyme
MNAVIAKNCNLNCNFCFAREVLLDEQKNGDMPLEEVHALIRFMQKNRIPGVNILGGEPTLHSEIESVLNLFRRAGIRTTLMTNALCDSSRFKSILQYIDSVLVNFQHPSIYSDSQSNRLASNLDLIEIERNTREKSTKDLWIDFGITLTSVGQDYRYLLDAGKRYKVRSLRWDLSKPGPRRQNTYIDPWSDPELGNWLVEFVSDALDCGLATHLDCPVPYCIFTQSQLDFMRTHVSSFRGTCRPPLDILPGQRVLHCFPLAQCCEAPLLEEMETYTTLMRYMYVFVRREAFASGAMDRCRQCDWYNGGQCQGYCPAFNFATQTSDGIHS